MLASVSDLCCAPPCGALHERCPSDSPNGDVTLFEPRQCCANVVSGELPAQGLPGQSRCERQLGMRGPQVLSRRDVADYLPQCASSGVTYATYDEPPPNLSALRQRAQNLGGWIPFPFIMSIMFQTLLARCDHVMLNESLLHRLKVTLQRGVSCSEPLR